MQAGLHLIKTSPAVSCPSISVSMFRFCWLSQFLLYQDIQTFTISIIPGHSDFADFHNFYQDIQTLLTFTISVISGHSDSADFDILKRVWLQMFWLKSPLLATSNNNTNSSNTQDSGWKKIHAYKFNFSEKQTHTNCQARSLQITLPTMTLTVLWNLEHLQCLFSFPQLST